MSWRELFGLQPRMDDLATDLLRKQNGNQHGITWIYDRELGALKNSVGATVNLTNIYIEYVNAPRARRGALFEKYLAMLAASEQEIPTLWALAAKGVFPAVRSRHDYMVLEIEARGKGKPVTQMVTWPLVGDLCVRLLYDFGPNMGHVARERLETWGVSYDAVRQQALANLKSLQRPAWTTLETGVRKIQSEVAYEESFLLIDAVIDQLPFSEFAVVIPVNRGVLLAADSRSNDALKAMLSEAIQSLRENPWPISATMLYRDHGAWCEFPPPSEIAQLAHAAQSLSAAISYRDQKDALEKYFESVNDDVFVATFDLRQRGEDLASIYSWCSWAEGVRSILPKTDVVIFGHGANIENQEHLVVPWNNVVKICGHYLLDTEEAPTRYRVTEFPNDNEWQQLKTIGESLK